MMRAMTVRQPWAHSIVYLGKTTENRAQTHSYRGPLAIHAGAAWAPEGGSDRRVVDALRTSRGIAPHPLLTTVDLVLGATLTDEDVLHETGGLPFGAVIGVAQLVDAHRAEPGCCDNSPWADPLYNGKQAVHYVLTDPQPLREPVPVPGFLGVWTLPDDVERAVRSHLPVPAVPL